MREILFKAKRIDNGEWAEGFISYPHVIDTEVGVQSYFFYAVDKYGFYSQCIVSADTICQYTGLTDKNGNKIWENDVVDIKHYAENAHEVKWGYGGFYVGINGLLCHYNTVCEVIGNIFDNPDLLKGE